MDDTRQADAIASSSPCVSIKAIPTASSEIQGEDFFLYPDYCAVL